MIIINVYVLSVSMRERTHPSGRHTLMMERVWNHRLIPVEWNNSSIYKLKYRASALRHKCVVESQ